MNDKIVTVATHTYERAQLLKIQLEDAGIECYLKNINLIQGAFSGGVKVRIKESDLDNALTIIERTNEEFYAEETKEVERKILMPVDFSEYSLKTCKLGMQMAKKTDDKVVFYHTYFNPLTNTLPFSEAFTFERKLTETLRELEDDAREDMRKFTVVIKSEMKQGRLPTVEFETELVEGIPEERIIQYSKKHQPKLIIMGTRGKSQKDNDLIGSVTAEVIERTKVPVLAIPEDAKMRDFDKTLNIAYATDFDRSDFEALEKLMSILRYFSVNIHCMHVGTKGGNEWDNAKLEGMRKLLEDKYPTIPFNCRLLEGDDLVLTFEKVILEHKIDAIALTTHRRNIIARLFNPSIARKMLFHTNTPLLIFHSKK